MTSHHRNDGEIDERVMQAMRECTHQVARFHGEDEQGAAGVPVGATCVVAECGLSADVTLQALERLASAGHLYSIGAIEYGSEPHYVLAPHLR
ncbi:MAG: hypothetical protein M3437_02590 [Chloroflexota bacterium]|nr:hypothetical protein [Chloroflexota bacterium]MDQ5865648.1 hypothetical protein [Chloroflexota bacterium]